MSNVSPINSYTHLSGEPPGSPEQGPLGPTNSTALELPQEGHNLQEAHNLLTTPFKLGSGAVAPRPFAARLRRLLAARILHFLGLPYDLYDPNHKYNHATLRRVSSYLLERWYFRLVLCCVLLAILFGHILTKVTNPAAIIQVGERTQHHHSDPRENMNRAEHPGNMTWHNNSPINATDTNSVRRLIRRRTLTAVSSPR